MRLGVNDELEVDHVDTVGTIEKVIEILGVGEEDKHREGERVRVGRVDNVPELEGLLERVDDSEGSREGEASEVVDVLGVLVREVLVDRVRAGTVGEGVACGDVDQVARDAVEEAEGSREIELVSDGDDEVELDRAPLKDPAVVRDKEGVAL